RTPQAANEFAGHRLQDDPPVIFNERNQRPLLNPETPAQPRGNDQLTLGRNRAGFHLHSGPLSMIHTMRRLVSQLEIALPLEGSCCPPPIAKQRRRVPTQSSTSR